jgi:hypothetical protein
MTTRAHRRSLWTGIGVLALAAAFVAAGGCGVGDPTVETFGLEGIGPDGGSIQKGDIYVDFPPGALPSDTAIEILPQWGGLPIAIPQGDPCLYGYLGPIWCCGPIGMDLAVPAYLAVAYDPNLIPPGRTENDLVLLLWDDVAQVMRPITNGVTHDAVHHVFTFPTYGQLGHIAVGVRNCPLDALVFLGVNVAGLIAPAGTPANPDGLYLAQADNSTIPVQLPTEGSVPGAYVCAEDGSRVLYEDSVPQLDAVRLRTVPTAGGGGPVTVVDETHSLNGGDPTFGWRHQDAQVFFQEFVGGVIGAAGIHGELASGDYHSRASADGSAMPETQYYYGQSVYAEDVRQSDDGSLFLLRLIDFSQYPGVERIDVIDAATGSPLSIGVIPIGGGEQTPRFVPGSTDIYEVDAEGFEVDRYAPDGTFLESMFDEDIGILLDFLIAPDGDHFAYVIDYDALGKPGLGQGGFGDELDVGTFSQGETGFAFLGQFTSRREMVFHPNGSLVYLDMQGTVRVFQEADALELPSLPVNGLFDVDVSTVTGQLLLVVGLARPQVVLPQGTPPAPAPGLYVAPPDGSTFAPVGTLGLTANSARWLRSWRKAPGMFYVSSVR